MSKTPFSKKCNILSDLWFYYKDRVNDLDDWNDFFVWADLGLPLAHMISTEVARPTDEGKKIIDNTWNVLCEMIDIDRDGRYEELSDLWNASPQPKIDIENE